MKIYLYLLALVVTPVIAENCPSRGITKQVCAYSPKNLSFEGSAKAQATCLLRPVLMCGEISSAPMSLPTGLDKRIGTPVDLKKAELRNYLAANKITEAEVGGSLDRQLSKTERGSPAHYFVIHDTSAPNYERAAFPSDINEITWKGNRLKRWDEGEDAKAHVFINRSGQSLTVVPFQISWRGTKFESKYTDRYPKASPTALRGRFLHVELIQPRRSARSDGLGDAQAPDPGFTEAQYERLALTYIAASIRAEEWLIPAYHAGLDLGISDAHDDPQKFDLDNWSRHIDSLVEQIATAR